MQYIINSDKKLSQVNSIISANTSTQNEFASQFSSNEPVAHISDYAELANSVKSSEAAIKNLTVLTSDLTKEYLNIEQNVAPFFQSGQMSDMKDQLDILQKELFDKGVIDAKPLSNANANVDTNNLPSSIPAQLSLPTILPLRQSKAKFNMPRSISQTSSQNKSHEIIKLKQDIDDIRKSICQNSGEKFKDFSLNDLNIENYQSSIEVFEEKLKYFEDQIEKCHEAHKTLSDQIFFKLDSGPISDIFYARSDEHQITLEQNCTEIAHLATENNQFTKKMDELFFDMNDLKLGKVNKEDFEEILCTKADLNSMLRKVDEEHFNAWKRDFSDKLLDIIGRLNEKALNCEKRFLEVDKMIDGKPNKEEINPFKVFQIIFFYTEY